MNMLRGRRLTKELKGFQVRLRERESSQVAADAQILVQGRYPLDVLAYVQQEIMIKGCEHPYIGRKKTSEKDVIVYPDDAKHSNAL